MSLDKQRFYFAIGDLHACYQALETVISVAGSLEIPVVLLGDYLDRGPSSVKTIELLIKAKERFKHWVFLLGNHEKIFLESTMYASLDKGFSGMGGFESFGEYAKLGGVPDSHLNFFKDLVPFFETEEMIFVHGGVSTPTPTDISCHPLEELVWTYDIADKWEGKKLVRGHRVERVPIETDRFVGLDTGCCMGRYLSMGFLDAKAENNKLVAYIQIEPDGSNWEIVNIEGEILASSGEGVEKKLIINL